MLLIVNVSVSHDAPWCRLMQASTIRSAGAADDPLALIDRFMSSICWAVSHSPKVRKLRVSPSPNGIKSALASPALPIVANPEVPTAFNGVIHAPLLSNAVGGIPAPIL